jgi:hypothetical protein
MLPSGGDLSQLLDGTYSYKDSGSPDIRYNSAYGFDCIGASFGLDHVRLARLPHVKIGPLRLLGLIEWVVVDNNLEPIEHC